MDIKIEDKNNGYLVRLFDGTPAKEYVFKATDIFEMLEFVGKYVYGRKVKVTEN